MNHPIRGHWRTAALLASALAATHCATGVPGADDYRAPPPGASWSYAQKNSGSYGRDLDYRVTRAADGTWQSRPAMMWASSRGITTVLTPQGKFIAVLGIDGKPLTTWEPPIGWDHPLAVGQKWTRNLTISMPASNRSIPFEWTCSVDDYGNVSVAAGSFKAFTIRCRNTIGTQETFWPSPELGITVKTSTRRDATSPFGVGTQDTELVAQDIRR